MSPLRADAWEAEPVDEPTILSVGEVAALATQAARGTGLAWGVAEEFGHAAAWLHARGIAGLDRLADHLAWGEARGWPPVPEALARGAALDRGAPVSSVLLGVALSDFAPLQTGEAHDLGRVHAPLLLLPHLGFLIREADEAIELRWTGHRVVLAAGLVLEGDVDALAALDEASLTVTSLRARGGSGSAPRSGAVPLPPVGSGTLEGLKALALRTCVPASAASRAGAGSDRSDND